MEYLSILEFADIAGLTVEQVYTNIFDDVYSGKTKEEQGKIYISADCLPDNEPQEQEQAQEIAGDNGTIIALEHKIELLEQENAELKAQINAYALRFADLAEQAQRIAGQEQILHSKTLLLAESIDTPQEKKWLFRRLFGGK